MATVYGFDTIQQVRRKVGDRTSPYHFDETDYCQFLTDASGNVNGAAALALQARATEEAVAWTSATVGGISRSKTTPADALMKLAQAYAKQSSGTVVLDDSTRPAFGRARIDYNEHLRTDTETPEVSDANLRRIRSEELED